MSTPQDLHVGKKLANEFWLPGLQAATMDTDSDIIQSKARQASASFGGECHMLAIHNSTYSGQETHLVGLVRNGILIGLYEVSDYSNGALFKRVCDHPVRELVRLGKLSASWPRTCKAMWLELAYSRAALPRLRSTFRPAPLSDDPRVLDSRRCRRAYQFAWWVAQAAVAVFGTRSAGCMSMSRVPHMCGLYSDSQNFPAGDYKLFSCTVCALVQSLTPRRP